MDLKKLVLPNQENIKSVKEKLYQCNLCDKILKGIFNFQTHMKDVHEGAKRETHECNICSRKFNSLELMCTHIERIHEDKVKYECVK